MSEYPNIPDVMSVIFKALHEHYDATTDASSDLCIQYNMNPSIIDIHDVLSDYHLSITVVGEDWEY